MKETYPRDVEPQLKMWGKQFFLNSSDWSAIPFPFEYEIDERPTYLVSRGVRACANDLIYNYEVEMGIDDPTYGVYDGLIYWSGNILNLDYWECPCEKRFRPRGLAPTANGQLLMLVEDIEADDIYYMLLT